MKPKLVKTSDGSHTLFLEELDEQYHSLNGAITESKHVYLESGYLHSNKNERVVFEVGFGTGLNCLLTALESEKRDIPTTYITVEKFPLPNKLIEQLNYTDFLDSNAKGLFDKIHKAVWGKEVKLSDTFSLLKIELDITSEPLPTIPMADVIYFDAFGPDKQPEMWEMPIFEKIDAISGAEAILVTYSVKGIVRRRLKSIGFQIKKLPGPPGKNEILRGIKIS